MKTDDFYRLMKDSSELTETTLPVLKEIVDEYPWFQAARILYLKNLIATEDIRFPSELRKMAVSVPDRRKLFLLLEGEKYGLTVPVRAEEPAQPQEDNTFSLIDTFLSTYEKEKESGESLLIHSSVSSDYIYWTMTNKEEAETEQAQAADVPLKHQDLIDQFIREEKERPAGNVRFGLEELPAEAPEITPDKAPDEGEEEALDDSYFTETLAGIYVKQKRYDKALQIIKNLSLNYPEKSIYFADQIRFLEKLIINTKK
ncbi:hypothetical protein [Parabacteroides sp. PF5-6]|uniref:hypothetical protein n=1 Tax=Parabacteroides sp. PF5-6 TaxID=1742403 RepID=UPI002405FCB0|nr:hypothetical protein [Parabacteroides sp. PF5-6]MDF9831683.1 hypothetical protein [Parabacteroides sp. PF5-6]